MLALTFANPADYDKVREGDMFTVACSQLAEGKPVDITVRHASGEEEHIQARHTYNELQIKWFKAGSALASLH